MLALDCRSFGGQAGASARIENYLGFPTGISGMALMGRAFSQAQKFGVEMAIPDEAVKLECGMDPFHLQLANGERIQARAAVIATGARYRRLDVPGLDEFEGGAVHYWASPLEANLCATAGGRFGRRRQFGRPGGGLPRRPCRQGDPAGQEAARRDHVGLSGRAHPGPGQCRGGDRRRGVGARGQGRRARGGAVARASLRARRRGGRSPTSSPSSAPIPIPTGWRRRG